MRTHVLALAAAILLAGCTMTGGEAATGEFELLVSDQPVGIDAFSSLEVTFSEARVFPGEEPTNASNATEEDYISVPLNGSSVDLTTVTGAAAQSLVNASLPAGNYSKIELHVSAVDAVVDGETVQVQVPSEKLMLTAPFTIAPDATTRFVFDIHVVEAGGRYVLRPVIANSGVVGEDVGQPEPPERGNGTGPGGTGGPANATPPA